LSVASCDDDLASGPLGGCGLCVGGVSVEAVGGLTTCGAVGGVSVGTSDGVRGAGRGGGARGGGAAGFGGGVARGWRSAGKRLPQCTHSRASSGLSCAQKGQNRMPDGRS